MGILAPKSDIGKSLVKFSQQNLQVIVLSMFVWNAQMHARTLWKHNASGHYIGGDMNNFNMCEDNTKQQLIQHTNTCLKTNYKQHNHPSPY